MILLRKLRKDNGLTQVELAEKSGINKHSILRLENSQTMNPCIETLETLAKALGWRGDLIELLREVD